MKLPLSRIAEFTQATGEFDGRVVAQGYSIDSRTLQPGDVFFAVKGEHLDGHDYVDAALAAGAAAAVVSKDSLARFSCKMKLLAVDDPLKALQSLGAAVRRLWGKPVVGITGSAGKTTTKEAIAHVLASRLRVLKSQGNLNNHFGMPLQLLRLEPEHDIAVIEMGMNHAGEISALAALAKPDIGVVTNVGTAHLEYFESQAGIARAKYELIASLPSGGTAVLNADDEYVAQFGRDFHGQVIMYGIQRPADVSGRNVQSHGQSGSTFDVIVGSVNEHATMPLVGTHNILNGLAAVAVASTQGIEPSTAVAALATLAPTDKRGEVLHLGGATILDDCYNSNPNALRAMVDALVGFPAKRHIVVAGEMLELGPTAPQLHHDCGRYMAERGVRLVIGVRGNGEHIAAGAREGGAEAVFVEAPEEAGQRIVRELSAGDAILFKASRGVRLERGLEVLKKSFE